MDIRTVLIAVHLVGLVVGLGAATIADVLFMNCLLKNRMSNDQFKFLKLVTDLVVFGLGILLVSGFGFLAVYQMTDPHLIMNPKIWGKVSIVLVLTLNGLLMHEFILPLFQNNLNRPLFSVPKIRKNKFILFACGGVSFTAWYSALILGVWKQANFAYTAPQIFGTYLALACVAVLTTPVLSKVIITLAERFGSDLVQGLLSGHTVWGTIGDGQDMGSCYGLLKKELRRANRMSEDITMITVSLPAIEHLRDALGAPGTDHLLRDLTFLLHGRLRENDHLCVIGHGKFLIILPATDEMSSKKVSQRLSRALDQFGVDLTEHKAKNLHSLDMHFVLKSKTTKPEPDASPEATIEQVEALEPVRAPLRLVA